MTDVLSRRAFVAAATAAGALAQSPSAPIRLMLVTGGHDYEISFYTPFLSDPSVEVTVSPHPAAYNRDLRPRFDALLLYDAVDTIPVDQAERLRDFLEAGRGLVILHHAIVSFPDWRWWYEEVSGGRYLHRAEGGVAASGYAHDQVMNVTPVGEHPVLEGVEPFRIVDECYKRKRISPRVRVILKTDAPADDGPIGWISPYEKSRVVFLQLGHDHQAYANSSYQRLLRNAIRWAAGRTPGSGTPSR